MSTNILERRAKELTDPVLDTALELALAFGIGNLTMAAVARRSGVSRTTLYRRFADVNAVARALLEREFREVIEGVASVANDSPADDRLAWRLVEVVRLLRDHRLFRKLVTDEPEIFLPYVVTRLGQTQVLGIELISAAIRDGQAEGTIRAGDPGTIALGLVLVLQAHILRPELPQIADEATMREELRILLLGILRGAERS